MSEKVAGGIGCMMVVWGIIWGIFIRPFLWIALIGLGILSTTMFLLKR